MPQKIEKLNLEDIKEWTPESEPEMVDTYEWLDERIDKQLKESRKDVFGKDIDQLWDDIDRAYVPHKLSKESTGDNVVYVADDEEGWLSRPVKLGDEQWQSDIASNDFFTKIQTALSILVERNPEGVFIPKAKKFEKNTKLAEHLYKDSWQKARSKRKFLIPFIFNLLKYGWAIGRTFPRSDNVLQGADRENLNVKMAWLDDMAKANDPESARDWCWDVDYGYDVFKNKYPDKDYKNSKFVRPTTKKKEKDSKVEKEYVEENVVTCTFYENKSRDIFAMRANKVWIFVDKLPMWEDSEMKKLSCSQTYCALRHTDTVIGIGLIEAMKESKALKDKLLNMTVDQLVLSIYKMFFHSGSDMMDGSGKIEIKPGEGQQMIDPKDINWLDIPGPGAEAWKGIEFADKMIDEDSGITRTLEGEVTGKTLGEVFQAKEAALKRLKIPLGSVAEALDNEAYLTLHINELVYSMPEVIEMTDPERIREYMAEIQSDPELFLREPDPESGEERFFAQRYPEVQLNLEADQDGNIIETEDSRFFRIKPSGLQWEGIVFIKSQSILEHTKELDKQMKLEASNLILPLITRFVMGEFYLEKPIRQLLNIYDMEWDDWMPTQEEQQQFQQQQQQQQVFDAEVGASVQKPQAQKVASPTSIGGGKNPQQQSRGMLDRISGGVRKIFGGGK